MQETIFPNVEFISGSDIPSKAFLRGTSKVFVKVNDEGLTFLGKQILWENISSITLKFFNSNPYFQINTSEGIYSLFFEKKFYYRRKAPWFGASDFYSIEFVKLLEEKNLFTKNKLDSLISQNITSHVTHNLWNSFFYVIPPLLLVASIVILYLGFTAA